VRQTSKRANDNEITSPYLPNVRDDPSWCPFHIFSVVISSCVVFLGCFLLDGHLDCEHPCKDAKGGKRDVRPIHNRVEHLLEKHHAICGMADNGIRASLDHPGFLATPYHSPTFVRLTEYSIKSEFQGKASSAGRKSEWSFPLRSNDVLRQSEL